MSLKYDFYEVNELNNTKGKYRARAVSQGKISTEKLTKWISQCSGVSAAEAKGFIEILTDSLLDFVGDGYEVEVGKLGYFSASVTSELVDDPKKVRAESIRFNKLVFRTGIQAKKRIAGAEIERVSQPRYKNKAKQTTREQRWELLKKYLINKPVITRTDYTHLTGIRRTQVALDDLNSFIEDGLMERHGAGRTVVYIATKRQ